MSEIDAFLQYMPTARDIEHGTPATIDAIQKHEQHYGVQFPADLREYFLKINGIYEDGGFIEVHALSDLILWSEYPYRDADLLPDLPPGSGEYFYIGHYDIQVWEWVILLSSDSKLPTPVYVVDRSTVLLADNFSQFLQCYRVEGAEFLFGYGGKCPS